MVERRRITPEFLDSVESPERGERWIADTELRGFGLRLWGNRRGGSIAFAIRTTDRNGKVIRKTFDLFGPDSHSWRFQLYLSRNEIDLSDGIPLHFFLEDARSWARKVIDQAKGRIPTDDEQAEIDQEDRENRKHFRAYLEKMTLGRAAEITITYGPHRGWSEPYMDKMNWIFSKNIPEQLKDTPIAKVTEDDIRHVLASETVRPANARDLRSLLHQVFWRVYESGGPSVGGRLPHYAPRLLDRSPSKTEEFIETIGRQDFEALFRLLEVEGGNWPQLYCLRLSFQLRAPFSRLMAARWHQIIEDRWYPFAPGERKYWDIEWSRINLRTCKILERVNHLALANFGGSRFWFPSRISASGHISNTDRVWRRILQEIGWPHASVSLYAARYRRITHFDDVWLWPDPKQKYRRTQIVAKLSKIVKWVG